MNINRKHTKILGFVRAQIKKVKGKLHGEAAEVYKRNGTAWRGAATTMHLQCLHCQNHHSRLNRQRTQKTRPKVSIILMTGTIALHHRKRTHIWT